VNLQQIFDTGVAGILAQGGYSYDAGGHGCLYRGPNGCKCALGHSIPDDGYDPSLEGDAPRFSASLGNEVLLARLLGAESEAECTILRDFQIIHDFCARRGLPLSKFKAYCRRFAKRHGLKTDVLA